MKKLASLAAASLLTAFLAGCSAPVAPTSLSSNADAYFFQQNTTYSYTYSQDKTTSNPVATYGVTPPVTYGSFLSLVSQNQSGTTDTLLLFKNRVTSDGTVNCILSNSPTDIGIIVLKGTLDLGAAWYADTAQKIQANVVGKYAEYYLPGRQIHYSDVVVVKYTDSRAASDSYVIRYFARGYGLILERTITGITSEISNLQLISFQGSLSNANPDTKHDHWFNSNGHYIANMKPDDIFDK